MLPDIWGPTLWHSMHLISAGYPEKPSPVTKSRYKRYFQSLGYVLPCSNCAKSYRKFVRMYPIQSYLNSKKNLMYWVYLMHNRVNKKLKKKVSISWRTVCTKYSKLAYLPGSPPKKYCFVMKNANGKKFKVSENKVFVKK